MNSISHARPPPRRRLYSSEESDDGHQVAWQTYLPRLVIRAEGGNPGADPHA
jgi:hypothetical protein